MENLEKVCLNTKTRRFNTVKISLIGTISLAGLVLSVYSIIAASYLFALWYLLAFVLGLVYVVIKINSTFPTFIAADEEKLFLSSWKNGILPYRLPEKPTFFSDFIPEKIITDEVLIKDIDSIYVGSKRYFERTLPTDKMPEILKRVGEDKHLKNAVKKMDFFLVLAKDGEMCFMSVTGFDTDGIAELLAKIERNGAGVQIYTGIARLMKKRNNKKGAV